MGWQTPPHQRLAHIPMGGGGVGGIKAERVRRLVFPGVRTCSPFEKGILRLQMGGLGADQWGRG